MRPEKEYTRTQSIVYPLLFSNAHPLPSINGLIAVMVYKRIKGLGISDVGILYSEIGMLWRGSYLDSTYIPSARFESP